LNLDGCVAWRLVIGRYTVWVHALTSVRPKRPSVSPAGRNANAVLTAAVRFCLLAAVLFHVDAALAAPPFAGGDAFIRQHCVGCHGSAAPQARLDLTRLGWEPSDPDNFGIWVKVHDRVVAGEMPPAPLPRPTAEARTQFVEGLANTLTEYERTVSAERGRAGLRRLNSYEYENAIRDLLNVPWAQIKGKLPQDGEAYRFNKTGGALDVSHVQLARYMSSADYAMREAMASKLVQPATTTVRYYARQEPSLVRNFRPREGNTRTDRLNFPVLDSHAQPDVRAGRSPISTPETKEREAVGRVSSIYSDAGGFSWTSFRVPAAGRYKVRVKGYTIWVSGGGVDHWNFEGFGAEKAAYLYTPRWHRPNSDEVWPGRRNEPIGLYAQSSGQSRPLAEFDFTPEPTVNEVEVLLGANETIQTDGMRLFRTRVNGSEEAYINPLAQKDGMPGVAFQWIEVEGPLYDETAGSGYRLMFGDLPMRRLDAGAPGGVTLQLVAPPRPPGDDQGAFRNRFGPRTQDVSVEVDTEHPRENAERLLRSFMARAYRCPVEEAHVQRFLELFRHEFQLGHGFAKSLLTAYTAVLTSAGFLYAQEKPGKLDDYALATRLALFLWNSPPDTQLRSAAAAGKLHDPEVLKAQTERLLNDPKSRRFVEAFTDYWLDLHKIDDSSPSTTLYNDYELDDPLKLAAVEETRLFVQELLKQNLPTRNLIDSDFTFLNERLADHYGVPGVKGARMRKVTLPKDSVRGGLLTQASVLKVTANGTTTSPVLRGVWIMERILGYRTAPPPGVPAVEPDIRGAVTIRQQLDRHRADASCASCHRKIDPPGFALESFDVMGGWRERYRAFAEDAKPEPGIGLSGQPYAFHYGLPVDSAGSLPDGHAFKDIREFKKLLLEYQEETVARNLVGQLATYATGAPIGFRDRKQVDEILKQTRTSGHGVRSIIQAIVLSDLFQFK
jgi:mono/diheme cytochrome c family protein